MAIYYASFQILFNLNALRESHLVDISVQNDGLGRVRTRIIDTRSNGRVHRHFSWLLSVAAVTPDLPDVRIRISVEECFYGRANEGLPNGR